jgi:hypothetical protein
MSSTPNRSSPHPAQSNAEPTTTMVLGQTFTMPQDQTEERALSLHLMSLQSRKIAEQSHKLEKKEKEISELKKALEEQNFTTNTNSVFQWQGMNRQTNSEVCSNALAAIDSKRKESSDPA